MVKPVVLLGAGASVDAGVPDAHRLTKVVYDKLRRGDAEAAQLFGFVVAKLQVRSARLGGSPFDQVNIEDAYDALKRLLQRDRDVIGEFVSSWEPLIDLPKKRVSTFKIKDDLERAIRIHFDQRSGRVSTEINSEYLRSAIEGVLGTSSPIESSQILRRYVDTLAEVITSDETKIDYLVKFLNAIAGKVQCVATLNYDTLFERAAEQAHCTPDYGLSSWTNERLVRFQPGCVRLLKLHGSVNWFVRDQDDITFEPTRDRWNLPQRAMIFGGQTDKLNPNGPFLPLRHEFQKLLGKSTVLAVIGYSFSDDHLNAVIRSWLAVKRKAKIIVVDPDGIAKAAPLLRGFAARTASGLVSDTLEIVELTGGFAEKTNDLLDTLFRDPKPKKLPKSLKSLPASERRISIGPYSSPEKAVTK